MNNSLALCPSCLTVFQTKSPPAPPAPDPGAGYRLLVAGELVQEGDELYGSEGCWTPRTVFSIGKRQEFDTLFPTRRKITVDPGEGYQLLNRGETIKSGDEIYDGEKWRRTYLRDTVQCATFRRKITIDPGEGYRLLEPNEILAVGDELHNCYSGMWEKFYDYTAGQPLCPGLVARRRVEDRRVPVAPYPGDGYRMLKIGEVRLRGDEYWDGKSWNQTADVGVPIWDFSFNYRRKIAPVATRSTPSKQYRLLNVGEMIIETDEKYDQYKWVPARVGVHTRYDVPIRREISDYVGGPA